MTKIVFAYTFCSYLNFCLAVTSGCKPPLACSCLWLAPTFGWHSIIACNQTGPLLNFGLTSFLPGIYFWSTAPFGFLTILSSIHFWLEPILAPSKICKDIWKIQMWLQNLKIAGTNGLSSPWFLQPCNHINVKKNSSSYK